MEIDAALAFWIDGERVGGRLEKGFEHHVLQIVADVVILGLQFGRVGVRLGGVEGCLDLDDLLFLELGEHLVDLDVEEDEVAFEAVLDEVIDLRPVRTDLDVVRLHLPDELEFVVDRSRDQAIERAEQELGRLLVQLRLKHRAVLAEQRGHARGRQKRHPSGDGLRLRLGGGLSAGIRSVVLRVGG